MKGTALYRMHKPKELVLTVVTLLAHGCPLRAIVAAFGLDERTVARWEREAGMQCQRVHEHIVEAGRVELGQVQADELRVRVVGGVMWLAGALAVESRLWLAGSRPDPSAAFSGARLWSGASATFMHRRTGQLPQSGHPPLQGTSSHR
jgi:hypothetical protein